MRGEGGEEKEELGERVVLGKRGGGAEDYFLLNLYHEEKEEER